MTGVVKSSNNGRLSPLMPNVAHNLPAEAGEAGWSGSAAWAGWAPDASRYFLPRQ